MNPAVVALLAIQLAGGSVTFRFSAPPTAYGAAYVTGPLVECGSGRTVPLRGAARFVIHFRLARTALSFAKQRRLKGVGRFRELAKVCDFESDLGWAIGLDRHRAYTVSRAGRTVTITFR